MSKTTPGTAARAITAGGIAAGLAIGAGACQPQQFSTSADKSNPHPAAFTRHTKKTKHLPSGKATATSFWDDKQPTASGRLMSFETIASPYWPLGTKVKITYKGHSDVGVVEDFGPAEWAVAQHSPPAIVDLSEEMMADLTGSRGNSITVKFQVIKWGHGRTYRTHGTGHALAMGQ